MRCNQSIIGVLDNENIIAYNVKFENNFEVEIINLGGVITKIITPDKDNNFENIVLGYENINDYIENPYYYGAIIGRTSGRICEGHIKIEDKEYKLNKNYGLHQGHGGNFGFNHKIWDVQVKEKSDCVSLILSRKSPHLEENYPGNLDVEVTFNIYENYKIEGKYYNVLNIQMKDEFENYDYSRKKNIAINLSEMFKNEYEKYDNILINKNSKDYNNDIVKNETDAKVLLNSAGNTYMYTSYRTFKKNDKEYTEERSLEEVIIQQLNDCENKEELIKMINATRYSKDTLKKIIDIQDIKEKCNEIIYRTAIIHGFDYKEEIELLEKIPEYKDSKELKTREVASIFMLQINGGNHK